MKPVYEPIFYDVVKETQIKTGYELPHHIEAYIVMLLSSFIDKNDIPPGESFGEMFLTISNSKQAKELGDTCLFVSGVLPTLKKRHGISRRYFQDIGSTSYAMASEMNEELFVTLSKQFVFLSEFIETVTQSSTGVQKNLFQ